MHFKGTGLGGFTTPSNKGKSYIARVLRQLTGVLVIMLILILFKFTNNNVGNNLSDFIKNNFYADYSSKVTYAIEKYSPEIKGVVETFVQTVENQ